MNYLWYTVIGHKDNELSSNPNIFIFCDELGVPKIGANDSTKKSGLELPHLPQDGAVFIFRTDYGVQKIGSKDSRAKKMEKN